MSFFSLTPTCLSLQLSSLSPHHPSVCLIASVIPSLSLPVLMFTCLHVCLCVYLVSSFLFDWFFWLIWIFLLLLRKNTHKHLYMNSSLSTFPLTLSFCIPPSCLFLLTHTHVHTTHSHQMQADGPSARQAADPCPHTPNEHPLSLGGPSQNQTPNTTNTSVPTATHYQPPACCDIPCALIVQHSYEPTNPSELNPKMRMTTFTTSPPTPRLYIQ